MADRFWGKNQGERGWEEGLSVLSFFSGKTGGPLPLGLDRGSVSGGGRGEQEGTRLHIPEILKPVGRGNSILRGQSLRHTQERKDKMECPVLRSVMSNSL